MGGKKRNGVTMINDNRFTLCELVIRVLSALNHSGKLHKKLANNGNNGWCVGWLRKPQDVSIFFFFADTLFSANVFFFCFFVKGLTDWEDDEILASVLAVSQQEYLDSMKKNAMHREPSPDSS